jgi:hypothetical protein
MKLGTGTMATPIRLPKRERAEAYASKAEEAEHRGDHRTAAALYQAAFLILEGSDEGDDADTGYPGFEGLPELAGTAPEAEPKIEARAPVESTVADGASSDRPEAEWIVALLGEDARRGGRRPPTSG